MSTERDWRALLDGVDLSGIEQMQGGSWEIRENLLDTESGKNKYQISKGLVNLELLTKPNKARLIWEAKMPEYMKPGKRIEDYMEFLYWIQQRIPMRLYPKPERSAWDIRKKYMEHSSVVLDFQNGKEKKFRFASEKEDKDLAVNFITRADSIVSYAVQGSESPMEDKFGYNLEVKSRGNGDAKIALEIPVSEEGLGAWNSSTLEWVLGTHKESQRLGEDLLPDSVELAGLIIPKIKKELL